MWTDGKVMVGRVREEKESEERISEKRKSQKKEDEGARKSRTVLSLIRNIWGLRTSPFAPESDKVKFFFVFSCSLFLVLVLLLLVVVVAVVAVVAAVVVVAVAVAVAVAARLWKGHLGVAVTWERVWLGAPESLQRERSVPQSGPR